MMNVQTKTRPLKGDLPKTTGELRQRIAETMIDVRDCNIDLATEKARMAEFKEVSASMHRDLRALRKKLRKHG